MTWHSYHNIVHRSVKWLGLASSLQAGVCSPSNFWPRSHVLAGAIMQQVDY